MPGRRFRALLPALTFLLLFSAADAALAAEGGGHGHEKLPPVWMVSFFVVMLLSIAILPLTKLEHWWEHNRNKLIVSAILSLYPLIYLTVLEPNFHALEHSILDEYIPFIILLGTLFYVSGGIVFSGDLRATPKTNMAFLVFGTLIASLVGTTGASMLLIRPVLRTNMERKNKVHVVVFFIFLVSNIGGSLLPIGDPPLFLGYLRGVPFLWTLSLWKETLFVAGALLVIFYFLDRHFYLKENPSDRKADDTHVEPLRVEGLVNLVWLVGIVLCVALIRPEHGRFLREAVMIACAVASRFTTPKGLREKNEFTWFPILEVAALFIGIFITMIPALMLLKANGGQLGVDSTAKFFWATGILSSFLDNAPTYLVFFETAQGMVEQGALTGEMLQVTGGNVPLVTLAAISCGAVYMGANTYIGNGPNFMVKAIAEEQGVRMPSFFGYMRWSLMFLVPLFVLTTVLFFM
ncbi:MAG: sodium:proton antiporter [Deltaproteobacteria bacterium]|nr:MAG: sodium:proton antiporter [Deltaproteobacteria bacterium]